MILLSANNLMQFFLIATVMTSTTTIFGLNDNIIHPTHNLSRSLDSIHKRILRPQCSVKELIRIIGQDKFKKIGENFYQVKVAQQDPNECANHAFRNLFYFMDLCMQKPKNIKDGYQKLVDKNSYDAFITEAVESCEVRRHTAGGLEVTKETFEHLARFLPTTGKTLFNTIGSLTFYNGKDTLNTAREFGFIELLKTLQSETEVIDTNFDKTAISAAAAITQSTPAQELYQLFSKFNKKDSAVIGINLSVFTVMQHAIALIIHKYHDITSYFLLDSMGWNYWDTYQENYKATIDIARDFIAHPEHIIDAYIRASYGNELNSSKTMFDHFKKYGPKLFDIRMQEWPKATQRPIYNLYKQKIEDYRKVLGA